MEMLWGRLTHPRMDLALSHSTESKAFNGNHIHIHITSDYVSVLDNLSQDVQTNMRKWAVGPGRDGNSGFMSTKHELIARSKP